ncbi:FkbM family methyltransferase [Aquimarina sp. ERC-38]|uniref:FkbM family methyltransferase n=1 Tax=Aquimarina sp. ERC-38 TaxID=2949996 RepID=UPI002247460C|nr:FkbM family methyltransferase [Aquimarina sp. ERC-38]UZO81877.1 FkbM family methyltransferase [Aquimarina sp. ERC-38]
MNTRIKKSLKSLLIFFHLDLTKNLKYDRLTKKILKKVLTNESNCIDIGCHEGEILEIICKHSPGGSHVALEPIPFLYDKLVEKFDNRNVEFLPYALSNTEKNTTFNVVKNALGYSGLKQRSYQVKKPEIEIIEVKVKMLDTILNGKTRIDLIKLDVEGAEFNVLKGAESTLKKFKPIVIFEFGLGASEFYNVSPVELYNFLSEEIGLSLFTLNAFIKSRPALTLQNFENHYKLNDEYYFIASP